MPQLPELKPRAPQGNKVTAYDRDHFNLYLRLLDGEAAGESWKDVATQMMGLDIDDIEAAKTCWQSHLERAKWIRKEGYLQLLDLGNWSKSETGKHGSQNLFSLYLSLCAQADRHRRDTSIQLNDFIIIQWFSHSPVNP